MSGRLNFKYKNPLSAKRENLILEDLEREEFRKLREFRTHIDCVLSGLLRNNDLLQDSLKSLVSHIELTLPYLAKKDTIVTSEQQKESLRNIGKMLRAGNKKLKKAQSKKKK